MASLNVLRTQVARNEAQAVADQVVAFRSWVAQNETGMIWVKKLLPGFHHFLMEQADGRGESFYGKNPALATRELAMIANREGARATFRITSDDYRQEENAPDAFEAEALHRLREEKGLTFVAGYEGDTYRYARPILVEQTCLQCHGNPQDAPRQLIEKYGSERAFNYKVGQVRGLISVTVPAVGGKEILQTMLNPYTVLFLLVALVLNIVFIRSVVLRLVQLTRSAEAIASGKLETPLVYINPSESHDELDQLYHAVNLLKRSLIILFKRVNNQTKD
jgi:methyl-accepting chemotaxis protein